MLRFFRQIRKKLMEQNKVHTYLFYALGEIFLVVIGILIALQINNWNEKQVQKQQLNEYIGSIIGNVQSDIIKLREDATRRDTLRATNRRARINFQNGVYNIEELKIAEQFFYEFYFTPNRSGYEALTNSGFIGKFSNTRIDSLLNDYYVGLDDIHEREVSYNTVIENVEFQFRTMYPAVRYHYLMQNRSLSEKEEAELLLYFKSNEFQAGLLRTSQQPTWFYYSMIDTGEELIKELEGYIYD